MHISRALAARAVALAGAGAAGRTRRLLGIAGPPGAGKSTFAAALAADVGDSAVVLPMDGYHRPQAWLVARGLADRKGAPSTFDAEAFVEAVRRVRSAPAETCLLPAFDRIAGDPVPGAIEIRPEHTLVIIEGNYLLLAEQPWSSLRPLLDEAWYLETPRHERVRRLLDRQLVAWGDPDLARAFVARSDMANAELVERDRDRADRVVRVPLVTARGGQAPRSPGARRSRVPRAP